MTGAGVNFLLPGTWWHVPLLSDESIRRSSAALAERTFGRSDELTQARSDLRHMIVDAAQKARDIDASDFYLAMEVVPGAPFPVSLTISSPQLPFQPSRLTGPLGMVDALSSSLRESDRDSVVTGWVDDDTGVVRTVASTQIVVGDQPALAVAVNYWLLGREEERTALLSFSASGLIPEAANALVELTDAIVSTVAWRQDADLDDSEAEAAS